jgi:hypothetical protein
VSKDDIKGDEVVEVGEVKSIKEVIKESPMMSAEEKVEPKKDAKPKKLSMEDRVSQLEAVVKAIAGQQGNESFRNMKELFPILR